MTSLLRRIRGKKPPVPKTQPAAAEVDAKRQSTHEATLKFESARVQVEYEESECEQAEQRCREAQEETRRARASVSEMHVAIAEVDAREALARSEMSELKCGTADLEHASGAPHILCARYTSFILGLVTVRDGVASAPAAEHGPVSMEVRLLEDGQYWRQAQDQDAVGGEPAEQGSILWADGDVWTPKDSPDDADADSVGVSSDAPGLTEVVAEHDDDGHSASLNPDDPDVNKPENSAKLQTAHFLASLNRFTSLRRSVVVEQAALDARREEVCSQKRARKLAEREENAEFTAEWLERLQESEQSAAVARQEIAVVNREQLQIEEENKMLREQTHSSRDLNTREESAERRDAAMLNELQAELQRRNETYWDDAPWLTFNADDVAELNETIATRLVMERKLEEVLVEEKAQEQSFLDSESAVSGSVSCSLLSPLDRSSSRTDLGVRSQTRSASPPRASPLASPDVFGLGESTPARPFREVSTREQSPQIRAESSEDLCHSAVAASPAAPPSPLSSALSAPRPPSPVHAALSALESENERLRERVRALRALAEQRDTVGPQRPQHLRARAVSHLRQALHDDVALLRSLHCAKSELDRHRRKERKLRASLERQLSVAEAAAPG